MLSKRIYNLISIKISCKVAKHLSISLRVSVTNFLYIHYNYKYASSLFTFAFKKMYNLMSKLYDLFVFLCELRIWVEFTNYAT